MAPQETGTTVSCTVSSNGCIVMKYESLLLSGIYSCDADPVALAKYVVALLRKEKPKSALRELCVDQLEVFLAKGKALRLDTNTMGLSSFVRDWQFLFVGFIGFSLLASRHRQC